MVRPPRLSARRLVSEIGTVYRETAVVKGGREAVVATAVRRREQPAVCQNRSVRCCVPSRLPTAPGAYVLEFRLTDRLCLSVGCLGELEIRPGSIRYYGSARGPGGLRARILRHLSPAGRRDRWHVDALTRAVAVDRVWLEFDLGECEMVGRDLGAGWQVAVPGFGSSDCRRCPSHLLWLAGAPN